MASSPLTHACKSSRICPSIYEKVVFACEGCFHFVGIQIFKPGHSSHVAARTTTSALGNCSWLHSARACTLYRDHAIAYTPPALDSTLHTSRYVNCIR